MTSENQKSISSTKVPWLLLALATVFLLIASGRHTASAAIWIAMLFLLHFLRSEPRRLALPAAWIVLTATWAFQMRGMVPLPGPIYLAIACLYGTLFFLPLLIDRLLAPRISSFAATLVLPCSWVMMEWSVATFSPFGSWCSLAYSQHESLALLQLTSVTGLYGVSFLITWFASTGSWLWRLGFSDQQARRGALIYAGVFFLVHLGGGLRLALMAPDSETVKIASLSEREHNLFDGVEAGQEQIRSGELSATDQQIIRHNSESLLDSLLERSERQIQAGARIVFWGETNGLVFKDYEPEMIEQAKAFAREREIYLGLSPGVYDPTAERPLENKIMLFDPKGELGFEYWKAFPVPGAEAAMQAIDDGVLESVESPYGRLGAAICFDMDFPGHLKQAGKQEVDILLVPANDWQEIDPWHSHMARFRAVEQGFNLVRHTSNGLSIAADYQGRVLATMDHFITEERNLVAHVPTRGVKTIYSQVGDLFVLLCVSGFLLLWISHRQPKNRFPS